MKNYLQDIDEEAFFKWLRDTGWTEDTSPETENWKYPAWWHAGKMVARPEPWLVDDYLDYLFEQEKKDTP